MKTSTLSSVAALALMAQGCNITTAKQSSSGSNAGTAESNTAASSASGPVQPPPNIAHADLQAAATDSATKAFYGKNGWQAAWSTDATQALTKALAERQRNGLDHVDFGSASDQGAPAKSDIARTRAALAYAAALAHGVIDPTTLHKVYTIPRPDPDLAAGLLGALQAGTVGAWLNSLAPQDGDYKALSAAYLGYLNGTPDKSAPTIPDTKAIHVGDHDPRIANITMQLVSNGYLPVSPSGVPSDAGIYAPALANAVKQLQLDYGLKADGTIGGDTLDVLNQGPEDKARALGVEMERRRWLSRTPPATRIDVNTAAATLTYYRDGKIVDRRKVIVGKPGKETPPLRAPIYRLVANPTWTVPKSIQHASLGGKSAAYLKAHGMAYKGGFIVQQSGPKNALGLVKFDMRDDQAIYLHDTSDHSLFGRIQRHLSHGCVRVDGALGFAQALAQQQGILPQWQQARQAGKESFVTLPQPIPVRLLYWNAFQDTDGKITFRTDPYGWNPAISKALGFPAAKSVQPKPKDIDIGP